jgi:hypothetical protein
MDANLQQEFTTAIAAIEKIRATLEAREEMPSAVLDVSEEPTCQICSCAPTWQEIDKERGICSTCAEHMDEGLKYYTEDFAYASVHGKDATHLFILRQRADNCRDVIAAAAGSYDGYLELHDASLEEEMLNKRAAECLARLPASFAPWWKDAWTHEKWCQVYDERKAAGWPLASADVPIVQRLAAASVAKEDKMHEMKKAHAEVLANIERARKEDLEAVEARYQRQLTEEARATAARHKREMAERDKRYVDALGPLLGVRDRVLAECEKKCEDANRKGYAMGYAFADQKWNPVYKAVCEELELVRKEGANHEAGYIRLTGERDELILAQADLRQELDESAEANEKLEAQAAELCEELAAARKELSGWCERCMAAQDAAETLRKKLDAEVAAAADDIYRAMRSDLEEMRAENKVLERRVAESNHWRGVANQALANANWDKEQLVKSVEALRELVGPTQKLMQSNPELFGGEARGASSPRPPPIIRLKEEVSEEGKQRALNFLKSLVAPSRSCLLVESPPTVLPGIVEAEPSTEGMCMALTEAQYEEMFGADRPSPLPPIVPDEPKVCGTAGCIDCPVAAEPVAGAQPEPVAGAQPEPVAGAQPEPVAGAQPEPVAGAQPEPVAGAQPEPVAAQNPTPVCCVGCGKPKPNYNHPNWPSPITKRFAKHLAKHSGLRSPWHSHDPKTIKTHEDALEYIAKRVNISVETLLGWTMKQYQTTYEPWTLVKGPNNFHTGTAPATWWC